MVFSPTALFGETTSVAARYVAGHSRTLAQAAYDWNPSPYLDGWLYLDGVSDEHIVVREPTDVMLVRVADELPEIQQAWATFEKAVGLRGRKFYGAFDPVTNTYSVCAVLRPDDDPRAFGAERGTLPGGRYACVRLRGEPPAVYKQIGPTAQRLAQRPDADDTRPTLEYYRRHDIIDVLVPVV